MALAPIHQVDAPFRRLAICLACAGYGSIAISTLVLVWQIYATRENPETNTVAIDTRPLGNWGQLPYVLFEFEHPDCSMDVEVLLEDSVFYNRAKHRTFGKVGVHCVPPVCDQSVHGIVIQKNIKNGANCNVFVNATMWAPKDTLGKFCVFFHNLRANARFWMWTAGYDATGLDDRSTFVSQFPHTFGGSSTFYDLKMQKTRIPAPGVFVGWPWEAPRTREYVNFENTNVDVRGDHGTLQFNIRVGNPIVFSVTARSMFEQLADVLRGLGGLLTMAAAAFACMFVRKFPLSRRELQQSLLTLRGWQLPEPDANDDEPASELSRSSRALTRLASA